MVYFGIRDPGGLCLWELPKIDAKRLGWGKLLRASWMAGIKTAAFFVAEGG